MTPVVTSCQCYLLTDQRLVLEMCSPVLIMVASMASHIWGAVCNIHTFVDRSKFCPTKVTFVQQKSLLSDKSNFVIDKSNLVYDKITFVYDKITFVRQKWFLSDKSWFCQTKVISSMTKLLLSDKSNFVLTKIASVNKSNFVIDKITFVLHLARPLTKCYIQNSVLVPCIGYRWRVRPPIDWLKHSSTRAHAFDTPLDPPCRNVTALCYCCSDGPHLYPRQTVRTA